MHILNLVSVLTIAAFVTACGDTPNPVGPTVATLVIGGADYVLTGATTAYTATATLSDGSTRTVTPSWSSSAVNVATVDTAGRLDGRAHGSTTLIAAHDGRSASKTIQVVNNYGGRWSGRYIYRACRDTGIVPWCQDLLNLFNRTGSMPFAFTLVQTGGNYSEIRATFGPECDSLNGSGTISGAVTADGRLNLEGTLKALNWFCEPDNDLQLSGWDTNLDGAGNMTGGWAQNRTLYGGQSSAYEEVELVTMSRSATASTSQ